LAQFVLDFPTEQVPADIIHLAKRCRHSTPTPAPSIRDRVDISEDPSLPWRTVSVTLELNDGTADTERIPHPTGMMDARCRGAAKIMV